MSAVAPSEAVANIADCFSLLIYPFEHRLDLESPRPNVRHLSAGSPAWHPWWWRLSADALKDTLDDTYFFVPHIRALLYPETALLPHGSIEDDQFPAAHQVAQGPIEELLSRLPRGALLRLTLALTDVFPDRTVQVSHSSASSPIALTLEWIDTFLFPQGIGLLAIKIRPLDIRTTSEMIAMLRLVRPVQPLHRFFELAKWQWTTSDGSVSAESRVVLQYLIDSLTTATSPAGAGVSARLRRLAYKPDYRLADQFGQTYGTSFRPYSWVRLASMPPETGAPQSPAATTDAAPASGLDVPWDERLIYEIATCTLINEPDTEPHPLALKTLLREGLVAQWSNWRSMILHDNVVFLATKSTRMTIYYLAPTVEGDYFYMYVLALYQNLRLSVLSGEIVRRADRLHKNLQEARRIWNRFIRFRNLFWFHEITGRPQGILLFDRFQRALDVPALFQDVCDEVRELQEHYERVAERRSSALIGMIGFVGVPASILAALFGGAIIKQATWTQFGVALALLLAVLCVVWLVWVRSASE